MFSWIQYKLAAKIADAIEAMEKTVETLKDAQLETEEMYISSEDVVQFAPPQSDA